MTNDLSGKYGTVHEKPTLPPPMVPALWLPWADKSVCDQEDAETAERLRQEIARWRAERLRAKAEDVDPE